ncbi:MAG: hypothetical protein V3S69_04905 [Dehalococcoidales bacterium]
MELNWITGSTIAMALAAVFSVWWSIESRQDKKIDDLRKCTQDAHVRIFDKMAQSDRERRDEHRALSDKIENVWKYLVNSGKKGGTS